MKRCLALVVALAWLPMAAGEEPARSAPLTEQQKIKELNRLATEAQKLRAAGQLAEAVTVTEKGLAIVRELLGSDNKAVADVLGNLAEMQEQRADFAAARKARQEALAIRAKVEGKQHWRTDDARRALEHVGVLEKLSAEDRAALRKADDQNQQALALWRAGQYAPALPLYQQALAVRKKALGEAHPAYATSLNNLAILYQEQGDYAKALPLFQQALAVRKKALGEAHPDYGQSLNNLAVLYRTQRQYAKAMPLFQQALEVRKKALGEMHPDYAQGLNNLAVLYKDQGDYAKAIPLLQQGLEICKRALGEAHPDYATSLNNLAELYRVQGNYAKALPLYREAVQVTKKALGEAHPDYATSLISLAMLYQAQGDYARALPLYQQALDVRKKTLGEEHPDYALSLNNLAMLYKAQGDYARALPLYQQALEICKKALGETHPNYARSLNNLALLYQAQGDYAKALPLLRRASEVYKKALGEAHPLYATSLNNLAELYRAQGDYAKALPLFQQALEVLKESRGEAHPDYANSLNNLAALYLAQGDYARALPLFQQALEVYKTALGETHPLYAQSLNNLAVLYKAQGDYAKALPLFEQASAVCKNALGDAHPDYALSLNNLAGLHQDQGDYANALPLLERALQIRKKAQGEAHPLYALGLHNLAELYRAQGDYPKALPLYQQALEVYKKALAETHPLYALSLNGLAELYRAQGDYARALPPCQQALEVNKKALGESYPDYARSLNNLATLYQVQGVYDKALPLYQRAIGALRQQSGIPFQSTDMLTAADLHPHPFILVTLSNYGLCLQQQAGSAPSAAQLRSCDHAFSLGLGILDRLRDEVLEKDDSKLQHGAEAFDLVPLRIGVCRQLFALERKPADLHAAFATAEQGRARVFLQQLGKSRAALLGGVSPELRPRETGLITRLRRYDSLIERELSRGSKDPELLDRLRHDSQETEKDLQQLIADMEKRFPQYAALKHPKPCSLAQARACLAENEVALLFAMGSKVSYLVLVEARPAGNDPADGIALYLLPKAADIADLASALAEPETVALPARARSLGADGYRLLLASVADRLRGKDLVIVPGEALCQLPFELLVEDGKYLIEKHRIRYAPSLTALHMVQQWQAQRKPPAGGVWALGDPVYEAADPRVRGNKLMAEATTVRSAEYRLREGRRGVAFRRLVHSGAEVRAVQGLLPSSLLLTGDEATEAQVKTASASGELARYRYVHFASHGILGFDTGQQPALVLSLFGNDGKPDDDGGINDGFLRLDEVTRLKLNADLVVLSACRTGQGKLANGEGVSGLARAFLYAGSRGVVCSLWSVDDKATADLMTGMYRRLKDGIASGDALREAKLEMIKAGKAPLYWAPFILIGE